MCCLAKIHNNTYVILPQFQKPHYQQIHLLIMNYSGSSLSLKAMTISKIIPWKHLCMQVQRSSMIPHRPKALKSAFLCPTPCTLAVH